MQRDQKGTRQSKLIDVSIGTRAAHSIRKSASRRHTQFRNLHQSGIPNSKNINENLALLVSGETLSITAATLHKIPLNLMLCVSYQRNEYNQRRTLDRSALLQKATQQHARKLSIIILRTITTYLRKTSAIKNRT